MEHIADSSVELKGVLMYTYNFHMLATHYVKLSI
jgi:hypothetical protein